MNCLQMTKVPVTSCRTCSAQLMGLITSVNHLGSKTKQIFKSLMLAICTGLKTEWTTTLETTTQFPVNPGTVVEVTCSYSDAVNDGSTKVTCITETLYTFSNEPSCSIVGRSICA